ncbi:hypothetical protein HOD08_02075 [bacterium]|nr:hypothetical protein [bacterium]
MKIIYAILALALCGSLNAGYAEDNGHIYKRAIERARHYLELDEGAEVGYDELSAADKIIKHMCDDINKKNRISPQRNLEEYSDYQNLLGERVDINVAMAVLRTIESELEYKQIRQRVEWVTEKTREESKQRIEESEQRHKETEWIRKETNELIEERTRLVREETNDFCQSNRNAEEFCCTIL